MCQTTMVFLPTISNLIGDPGKTCSGTVTLRFYTVAEDCYNAKQKLFFKKKSTHFKGASNFPYFCVKLAKNLKTNLSKFELSTFYRFKDIAIQSFIISTAFYLDCFQMKLFKS